MGSELKPCPWCGSTDVYIDDALDRGRWQVCCSNNDCPMDDIHHFAATKEEAIAAWNTRHQPDAVSVVRELLVAMKKQNDYGFHMAAWDHDIINAAITRAQEFLNAAEEG